MDQQLIKQNGFNFEWKTRSQNDRANSSDYLCMRPWQVRAFETLKDFSFMILNAPMGSGKSWLMCLLTAFKLKEDQNLKCIIVVPQTIIAPGFVEAKLQMSDGHHIDWRIKNNLCNGSHSKDTINKVINWLDKTTSGDINDRVLLCTHATIVGVYKKLKNLGQIESLKNILLWIDEAHHVKNIEIEDFEGAVISNSLGELVTYIINNSNKNNQLGLTTASFFRGDRGSLLTSDMESKFERFNLPYDEYLQSMNHLKSFSFDFYITGPDYSNAIERLIRNRKGKDVIHIPHPTSRYSSGNKLAEVNNIIAKYKNIFGGEAGYTNDGTIVLGENNKRFILLDLVDENLRFQKKNFLNKPSLKTNSDELDCIIALGMFKEGANWVWADRSIIVGARSSLVDVIQIIGRLFRDTPGKAHVEVLQLLPFSWDQQDEVKFKDNLNNYLKAIFACLILENILNPIKIKIIDKQQKEFDDQIFQEKNNWFDTVVPDEIKRLELVNEAYNQLLEIRIANPEAKNVDILKNEYEKIMPRILEDYGISERKEEIAKQIWGMLARQTLRLKGISVENIDIELLQKTDPLEFLLRYTSGVCGIDTFQKLRNAIALSRGPWRPFEEAKSFVHSLKLKSETEWRLYIAGKLPHLPLKPHDIPNAPWVAYVDSGWINWGDFLGTNQIAPRLRRYKSYEDASDFAKSLRLKRKDDWFLYVKGKIAELPSLPDDIPAAPDKTYRREIYGKKWSGWADFLGTGRISNQEKSKSYRTYEESYRFAQTLGLKTAKEWQRYIKGEFKNLPILPFDIPRNPADVYEEWISWPKFIGSPLSKFNANREFWDFEKCRTFVHSLGLKCQREWVAYCAGKFKHLPSKPYEIPSNPGKKFKNKGWKSEKDWLGY